MTQSPGDLPIQPVEKPIPCSPYEAPSLHWQYDRITGEASKMAGRRPARYWYKTKDDVAGQLTLELAEGQDDLVTVNQLRSDVARWRESAWEGATPITKELLRHWWSPDRPRRLFFCQLEAVETVVYLAEILHSGRRPRFKPEFPLADLAKLTDMPAKPDLLPLIRYGCKMATGSGKTVVMAMLIAWAFCNRGRTPSDERFASGVLVCCPNLTVNERLQVLRPERLDNYYAAFDIVPAKLRPLMQNGRVLVLNWHKFAPESEHSEGGKSYTVVDKGAETPEAFARRVLGDLHDRMPIMVLNDEAHHCYRPATLEEKLSREEAKAAQSDREEATVWVEGLDKLNNHESGRPAGQTHSGIRMCVDLSATPFYLHGSGYAEGSPFPWLVSDFGLVDAIESGIVKIPRLPVSDTTGRPEPAYFKLWQTVVDRLQPAEFLPGRGRKPKPDVVFREAEGALKQLAGQWVERFEYIQAASPGQERVPPVLIIVCDNVDIAEVFYRKISGEEPIDVATEADLAEVEAADEDDDSVAPATRQRTNAGPKVSYGHGVVFPECFANGPDTKRTIRIDTDLLAKAESEEGNKSKKDLAEELRKVVATVGKPGEPGEHVRCVVSVQMLTEGWDANNVTNILGLRAFKSQLLCEQVVGRGLRRMDYTPDPETGLLTEEYVDVYGIPFTVIPFKGRPSKKKETEDKPKNHVKALPERAGMEMRFPVVEGYAFALQRNLIRCDIDSMEPLVIEPNREPTATFLLPTVGYQEGRPSQVSPFGFVEQDREQYYRVTHLQAIQFQIAQLVLAHLVGETGGRSDAQTRVWRLRSRHQLFPQVYRFVNEYVQRKVNFRGADPRELGLEKYVMRMVGYLCDAILPDDAEGEPPLLPVLNRYKPFGTTAEVDFKTTRPCFGTRKSHINQVVSDTLTWETSVAFWLERSRAVECYARNDHLGLMIPYEFQGVDHHYEPDFIVRLKNGLNAVLEVKGLQDAQTTAKHEAARRWVQAVNNAREHGRWAFHVCRDPQTLERELEWLLRQELQETDAA
ncbi:MAG: DEAD/DEAH box helicase family protein [Phycisphaerae bacterium]|nr:DEAD/DEAH box helicase family protein [Phycisphaerae bacterium]